MVWNCNQCCYNNNTKYDMCTLENACDIIDLSSDEAGEVEIIDWCSPIGVNKDQNSNFKYLQDEHLKDFIEKCLKAENSTGMVRVINRSLLPLYREAKPEYLNGLEFQKVLQTYSSLIENKPKFKFSYVKSVCENLRRNKMKKRINFITLDTNVKRTKSEDGRKESNFINLESTGESEDKNDVTIIENVTEEKENKLNYESIPETQIATKAIIKNLLTNAEESAVTNHSINSCKTKTLVPFNGSQDNLLVPQRIELLSDHVNEQINVINTQITILKRTIEDLEEEEVTEDNHLSPYVLCEAYKAKIVSLYKELCHLTKSPAVKKHNVRLSVVEGHSEAPVKILEKFLNNNIQSNGYPAFPNFDDVKICVVLANDIHKLGWDASKVMTEARALFTQCGRALQNLRQGREWKDLLSKVKKESEDPAEHDPELMAKLEANKQQAIKNETDIIEKYVQMENEKRKKHTENQVENNGDLSDSDDSVILCEEDMIRNEEFFRKLRQEVKIVKEEEDTPSGTDIDMKEEIVVKMEPLYKQLEDLGDNFTVTIEVEDPFLVVEISSDSDNDTDDL